MAVAGRANAGFAHAAQLTTPDAWIAALAASIFHYGTFTVLQQCFNSTLANPSPFCEYHGLSAVTLRITRSSHGSPTGSRNGGPSPRLNWPG